MIGGTASNVDPDDLTRYDEAAAQMRDPDRYAALRALTFAERHECPVTDCRLSAEEHHRLAYGHLSELDDLRRRVHHADHDGEREDFVAERRAEVDRVALLLIAAWERVDGPVNASRVANFADMARAVIEDRG